MALKIILVLFTILTILSTFITSEIIDDCSQLHMPYNILETIKATTHNIILDTNNENLFDGDRNRFKRPDQNDGILMYESLYGIEEILLQGFVYKGTTQDNWSLHIIINNNPLYSYDKNNFSMIKVNYSNNSSESDGWEKYEIKLEDKNLCSKKIEIVMAGAATDNNDKGWGLQISNVKIDGSYFEGCKASCEFEENVCPDTQEVKVEDAAEDSGHIYSISPNIVIDNSNSQNFDGDKYRFKRVNNENGEITYTSNESITKFELEIYQYEPYDTTITIIPYNNENCMPIKLTAIFEEDEKQSDEKWKFKSVSFDLSILPLCPKNVLLVIQGGNEGWELQVSKTKITSQGGLVAGNPELFDEQSGMPEHLHQKYSTSDEDKLGYWKISLICISILIFVLIAYCFLKIFVAMFGPDTTHAWHVKTLFGDEMSTNRRESA